MRSLQLCEVGLTSNQKTFFETGIKKLPDRWHKGTAVNGDYCGKYYARFFLFVVNKLFRIKFSFIFERPAYIKKRYLHSPGETE
jgi:hypothetical protein